MNRYSTKEVAKILSVADRSVRRYLKTFVSFENNKIKVSGKMLEILKKEYNSGQLADNLRTGADNTENDKEYDIVEGFSNEEYQEFQKRLIEYPLLQEELNYHKKSAESHQRQMEIILRTVEQKNFIEISKNKLKR